MASKPKPAPKPDPATIASSPGEMAKKQQELQARRKGGFYSGFKNISPTLGPNDTTGGGNQPLG
jgi:hypothetical protein